MLLQLAWRNLWRNPNRSLITMASVWCAVVLAVAMSSLQKGVFDHLISNVVSFYSGYVQVHRAGYQSEQTLENSFPLTDSIQNAVLSSPDIVERLAKLGIAATPGTPDAFGVQIRADLEKYGKVVKAAGIKAE